MTALGELTHLLHFFVSCCTASMSQVLDLSSSLHESLTPSEPGGWVPSAESGETGRQYLQRLRTLATLRHRSPNHLV
jgi:hypothetical protein